MNRRGSRPSTGRRKVFIPVEPSTITSDSDLEAGIKYTINDNPQAKSGGKHQFLGTGPISYPLSLSTETSRSRVRRPKVPSGKAKSTYRVQSKIVVTCQDLLQSVLRWFRRS